MPPVSWDTIAQLGAAGAVIVVVVMFLKHLATKDEAFNAVVTNHLEHSTAAQEKAAEANKELATALGELRSHCQHTQEQTKT